MLNIFLCHYCSHRSSCAVWAALHHQILQVALLWETLAAPVSGPTSRASWVEHAGIFEQSYLHFVFQLLEYASSIAYMCLCNFLECSRACFYEKAEPFGMSNLKSMWSRIFCTMAAKHGGIKTVLVCTLKNLKCTI